MWTFKVFFCFVNGYSFKYCNVGLIKQDADLVHQDKQYFLLHHFCLMEKHLQRVHITCADDSLLTVQHKAGTPTIQNSTSEGCILSSV